MQKPMTSQQTNIFLLPPVTNNWGAFFGLSNQTKFDGVDCSLVHTLPNRKVDFVVRIHNGL